MSIANLIRRAGLPGQASSNAPPSERERDLMRQLGEIEAKTAAHLRTIEQLLKFDSGLAIGTTPVTIERRDGSRYDALVDITARGVVRILRKPEAGDMYSSWHRVKGDTVVAEGAPIVWGVRDHELLQRFCNPVKVIVIPKVGA